jgi:hypothetical protein
VFGRERVELAPKERTSLVRYVVSSGLPAAVEGLSTNSLYPVENFLNPASHEVFNTNGVV